MKSHGAVYVQLNSILISAKDGIVG